MFSAGIAIAMTFSLGYSPSMALIAESAGATPAMSSDFPHDRSAIEGYATGCSLGCPDGFPLHQYPGTMNLGLYILPIANPTN